MTLSHRVQCIQQVGAREGPSSLLVRPPGTFRTSHRSVCTASGRARSVPAARAVLSPAPCSGEQVTATPGGAQITQRERVETIQATALGSAPLPSHGLSGAQAGMGGPLEATWARPLPPASKSPPKGCGKQSRGLSRCCILSFAHFESEIRPGETTV